VSDRSVSGVFIEGSKGPLFVVARRPRSGPIRGTLLVVPPFAEEMNKCRRMITETLQALASRGFASVVPDLHGTGDSDGDFVAGTWHVWRDDIARASSWSCSQGLPVTAILGIRLGSALAADCVASGSLAPVERAVLWQPVCNGERFLTQFLRLRMAASLMEDKKEALDELRARLRSGQSLEVAGYCLSSELAEGLSKVRTEATIGRLARSLHWMEVGNPEAQTSPATTAVLRQIRATAGSIEFTRLVGEPFWSSTEIVVIPSLVAATCHAIASP
jgi:exosortase A-associated hydrolase 2